MDALDETKKENGFNRKQEAFLKALEASAGNITEACRKVKIARQTFYNWRENNKDFNQAVEDVQESLLDFAESKLMELISAGNVTAIIFFLKTRGRSRGYSEKDPESFNPFRNQTIEILRVVDEDQEAAQD